LATFVGLTAVGFQSNWLELVVMVAVATLAMAFLGMLIACYLVMPLRSAPALNTLLITLMLGTVLRESVRLFYPQGANPKPFPALLPKNSIDLGGFNLRLDNVLMLAAGVLVIVGLQALLNRTKLGLAIRAVAQDARSQARNRELALERLRDRLRRALATPRRRLDTQPTRASVGRRLDDKRRQGQRKQERQRPGPDD